MLLLYTPLACRTLCATLHVVCCMRRVLCSQRHGVRGTPARPTVRAGPCRAVPCLAQRSTAQRSTAQHRGFAPCAHPCYPCSPAACSCRSLEQGKADQELAAAKAKSALARLRCPALHGTVLHAQEPTSSAHVDIPHRAIGFLPVSMRCVGHGGRSPAAVGCGRKRSAHPPL